MLLSCSLVAGLGSPGAASARPAPWPSMRHDSRNTGRSTIPSRYQGDNPWEFRTGRGLFITPVIDRSGTIYFGSADHNFYALNADGTLRWKFTTGGIIDAAAALGPKHTVTIGSGDENLYNLSTKLAPKRRVIWKYHATLHPATGQLVDWWEDDIAYGPDGNIYTGNTGGAIYSFTPDGKLRWDYQAGNSVWTMPAFGTGLTTFWGSVDRNVYALNPNGSQLWSMPTVGFVISSPAIGSDGTVYIASFDGKLYAIDPTTGAQKWSFQTNDHIYSSPALEQDASGRTTEIYLASTDGSVYALDPTGKLRWSYDVGDVIRSSLALAPAPRREHRDILYFGAADGTLYALNADTGTRRWSFDTTLPDPILHDRNDLNSSPALGRTGVYIGSEDGGLTYVPYDYCLHRVDARCSTDPGEPFGAELSRVFPVSAGGSTLASGVSEPVPPASEITGRLLVREKGSTVYAGMQPVPSAASLVKVSPEFKFGAQLSGDGRFIFITPSEILAPDTTYKVSVAGQWLGNGVHVGNYGVGGTQTGTFGDSFTIHTNPSLGPLPLSSGSGSVSAFTLSRLAVPMPAFLPSVNQIGFDSYDLIVGALDVGPPDASGAGKVLLWATGAKVGADGVPRADPNTTLVFPLQGEYRNDSMLLSVHNVTLTFSFGAVPIQRLDVRMQLDPTLRALPGSDLYAEAQCAQIPNYSAATYITGICNQEGILAAEGTFITNPYPAGGPANVRPEGVSVGSLALTAPTQATEGTLQATLALAPGAAYPASEHRLGLLLVDARTGQPVGLDYTQQTTATDAAGNIAGATLHIPKGTQMPESVRAYVIADAFPIANRVL
jgi:outer membrane protein assembly factor BamB